MFQVSPLFDVSRETIEKLQRYCELVSEWNRNTSLVQFKTLDDIWIRHIVDSFQLLEIVNFKNLKIIDIGTGAGFPGMVLAIAGVKNITLLDSNQRKCIFLEEVARQLDVDVTVLNNRCESLTVNNFEIILSRACSELTQLLMFMKHVSRETKNPVGYFHKGKLADAEIQRAMQSHAFTYEKFQSKTATEGVIIKITNLLK